MKTYAIICAPFILGVVQAANSLMEFLVLLAAAIAAIGIIWLKVVKPVVQFITSASEAIGHLKRLPEFEEKVMTRFQVIEGALYGSDIMESLPIRRRDDPPDNP